MSIRLPVLAFLLQAVAAAQSFDLVINNGRVMDPESTLDAVRHVGIQNGKIASISTTPLASPRVIDAKGLVVAPGFIDLHAHGQDLENQRYQAMDGVTTALELEVGAGEIEEWYRVREGKRLIHSGVSMGHLPARIGALRDPTTTLLPSGPAARREATPEEISDIRRRIERGLQQGALGVGFGIQYSPAASRWEILEVFRVATRFKAPVFVHIRHMGDAEPGAVNALEEVMAAAAITGTPLHVVHITSSGLRATPQLLTIIGEARQRGIDVTTECYPYNAAMTELQSAMFDPGWQRVLGISFPQLQWAATGERLTEATFGAYRKQGGMVIMHMIPDEVVELAVASPLTLIASDGIITGGKGHPRGAGTFARVLGLYVREKKVLPLMDAIRKIALAPAQRLESYVPAARNKGRIRVGADADITVFNPATVIDRATFTQPAQFSTGIEHVVVAGVPVVTSGKLATGVLPGRAVRR
jgi:N-acyl-D-aspartate/D-glutamate deacylase